MRGDSITRRTWLRQMAGCAAVAAGPWAGGAELLPHHAAHVRATDGDSVAEQHWEKHWVLTVGNRQGICRGQTIGWYRRPLIRWPAGELGRCNCCQVRLLPQCGSAPFPHSLARLRARYPAHQNRLRKRNPGRRLRLV